MKPFPGQLTKKIVDKPYITKAGNTGCHRTWAYVLTDEQAAWLCRWYPEVENQRICEAMGINLTTMHRLVRQLHLSKSKEGLRRIKKRQYRKMKQTCEANGWYDSLRGKPMSPQCRDGSAHMWREINEGKRLHPIHRLKSKNPNKYRRCMEQRSKNRLELIRTERRRQDLELDRKTHINIVRRTYTQSQVNHRHNAQVRGYFVMEDCSEQSGERYNIYYDKDTKRSARFEANLQADGFHVIEWKD